MALPEFFWAIWTLTEAPVFSISTFVSFSYVVLSGFKLESYFAWFGMMSIGDCRDPVFAIGNPKLPHSAGPIVKYLDIE